MLKEAYGRLKAHAFRTNRSGWYCSPLRDRTPPRCSLPAEMAFELLEGESREELHEWLFVNRERYPWIYFPGEISSAVSNNHVYPIVRRGDTIIGFIKLGLGRVYVHDFESEISFPADVGFIYDTFVEPESRAKGVARSMLSLVSWLLRARGFRSLWCHIEDQNTASIKAFGAAGFIRTGDVRYARLTWLRSWRINGRFTTQAGFGNWLDEHSRRPPPLTADGLLCPIPPTSISDPRTPGR